MFILEIDELRADANVFRMCLESEVKKLNEDVNRQDAIINFLNEELNSGDEILSVTKKDLKIREGLYMCALFLRPG